MARSSYFLGLSCSLLAAAALFACGGSQPAATTPAEPGAPSAEAPAGEAPGGAEMVWKDDMSTKDKGVFMKKVVVPTMGKTFKDYDAKKYEKFGCKTCHGPDMKPKPVDFLPVLHFKGGKMTESDTNPAMVKFMHDHVEPDMATVFGKQPYDVKTNSGFGCNGCHKVEM